MAAAFPGARYPSSSSRHTCSTGGPMHVVGDFLRDVLRAERLSRITASP